jgi:hypothetical protein
MKKIFILLLLIPCLYLNGQGVMNPTGGSNSNSINSSDTVSLSTVAPLIVNKNTLNHPNDYVTTKAMFESPFQSNLLKMYRSLTGDSSLNFPLGTYSLGVSGINLTGSNSVTSYFALYYTERAIKSDSTMHVITVAATTDLKGFSNKLFLATYNPTTYIATIIDSTVSATGVSDSLLWKSSPSVPIKRGFTTTHTMAANSYYVIFLNYGHSTKAGTEAAIINNNPWNIGFSIGLANGTTSANGSLRISGYKISSPRWVVSGGLAIDLRTYTNGSAVYGPITYGHIYY